MNGGRAIARVDRGAVVWNCERLLRELGGAELCAVVKADGYGHGAIECARAALSAGATWLSVATVDEARVLREAGIQERLIVMGALLEQAEFEQAIGLGADIVLWQERSIVLATRAAEAISGRARVHVKLDTGMGRLGARDPSVASRTADAAAAAPGVELAGVMTHFATADVPEDEGFFESQLSAFTSWAAEIKAKHPDVVIHAANSAAVLRDPRAHFDMARCGIAIYGLDPFNEDPATHDLRPALELSSVLAEVKPCAAGQSTGYGRRFVAQRDTQIGVLPIGYGDGWRRGLSGAAEVLIEGRRYPLVGTVSMDNVAVDLGPDPEAARLCGVETVLIGTRGAQRITAEELARQLHTINYEITCGLSARVTRVYRSQPAVVR